MSTFPLPWICQLVFIPRRRRRRWPAEKKVYLAVDARAKYGDAAAVAGEIGKAGIREICILAYKPEK